MKIFILLSAALALINSRSQAQFQDNIPEAKPIPPNAAAMYKVLDRPLGTFTGTIPISFPLCKVTSGPLSADVALNYTSTGGIRVEELASCVGLGFNLADGGGRITQQVRGLPDDDPLGMLQTPYMKPSAYSCSDMQDLDDYYFNWLDMEPDIYLYSFNGHSGKFFLKEDGTVGLMQNDPIRISYTLTSDGITSWTIVDDKGNIYKYGSAIINQSYYSGNNGSTSESVTSHSWYLDSASDMNGENKIYYSYVTSDNAFTTYSGGYMPLSLALLDCANFNTNYETGATVTTDGTELVVASIRGNSGYINFNSSPQYSLGPQQLNSIQIYDSSGNLRDQYHFHYGTPFSSERLCLNSFSEVGASGTDSLTHSFDYNTLEDLPGTLDQDVDIWGFYNGAGNNEGGLIPNLFYANSAGLYIVWDSWNNRSANGWYAQAGVLTRIHYPTGGYRQLTYEGNTALASGDFFQYHPDPTYMTTKSFVQTNFNYSGSRAPSMQQLFSVHGYFGVSKLYWTLDGLNYACNSDYQVNIMQLSDSTDLTGGIQLIGFNGQSSNNMVLPNGYYRVDVYVGDDNSACTISDISGNWLECTLDDASVTTPYGGFSKYPHNVGGVRISQIQDYDPVTGTTYTRSYKYRMYSTDSTLTSGLLASPVNITAIQNDASCGCQYWKLCPGSSYPLAMDGGSYVVYPEVRTIDSAKGWTDELFSFLQDDPSPTYQFPAVPPQDYSFARGHLLTQNTYTQNGTLLKKTTNSWDENWFASGMGVRSKAYWYDWGWWEYPFQEGVLPSMGDCTDFSVGMPAVVLGESIDSLYSSPGVQVNRTDYQYDTSHGSFFLQKKIAYINNNRTKEETYRYAFSPAGGFTFGLSSGDTSMKASLLYDNYLQPLEVVDSIRLSNGTPAFLGGARYQFGNFNSNGAIHPYQYRSYSSPVDSTVVNFTTYDSKGNLEEQYKTGDVNTAYLWGYHGVYPVAKVVGSTYTTVSGLITNWSLLNNPTSDSALRVQLNLIRTGLAGTSAQVTTYTYSPGYGMTSMTDPSGITTYYDYDPFGRLVNVRDQNHNILKHYSYKLNNP